MPRTPAIAIFDIGKTNKKIFLFDKSYNIIHEDSFRLPETKDEDGFPCEDLRALETWIRKSFEQVSSLDEIEIEAVNFSGYGASFVHLDWDNNPVTPLYNYLKPFPESIQQDFYKKYRGAKIFAQKTASPILGSLNSGLQLLRLRMEKPEQFNRIRHSLHLPQWLSYLFTGQFVSDITSIGCHTAMWNFSENRYHEWLEDEGIFRVLAPINHAEKTFIADINQKKIIAGIGLHDSSAALIPYLMQFREPFVLISTGTWNISLNPFNQTELTQEELSNDCLCYLDFKGKQVKASRLFAGQYHDQELNKLSEHFQQSRIFFQRMEYDPDLAKEMDLISLSQSTDMAADSIQAFDPAAYRSPEEGYYHLMAKLVLLQKKSTGYVLGNSDKKTIFVDGGFSRNSIYMNLIALVFNGFKVYAATVAQASAIGAAMAIHRSWNDTNFDENLIRLKYYLPGSSS